MSLFSKQTLHPWLVVLLIALMAAVSIQPALAQSTIDVVVHYVEGIPSDEQVAYDVTAYVSAADSTGNPVKDLKPEDFTLTEDSRRVDVLSADLATDAPISLVLLLDTSGSMSGQGITAAKTAASNFIAGLGQDDRVAIVTFDETTITIIDFTTDHRAARDELSLVEATRGAGTCLYDAAYQAVQMSATVPSGRRAVVLFTDGVDEKPSGGGCSVRTADDVIRIATESGTRAPVYTLGMGTSVDQNVLQRVAQNTGGRFLYSSDTRQLDTIFIRLSDSLRSQYAIKYVSAAGAGSHTLAVTAKYLNVQDTDTRTFLLPNFPLRLIFVEPQEGQEVSGSVNLRVETFGQSETIQSVVFQIDGKTVASQETAPYQALVDFGAYPEGELTIDAIALGADGIALARASQSVVVRPVIAETATPDDGGGVAPSYLLYFIGGAGLLGVAILVIVVMVIVRKRRERERDREWEEKVGGVGAPTVEEFSSGSDTTMDSWEMPSDAYGRLIVLASDDPAMINQHFDITHSRTALGRKADNDIIFPKDSPVSRHHAVIEERNGGLFLEEVEDDGKLPTYNTFVNERDVRGEAILLQNSDEIRLGKRVRLRFEVGSRIQSGDDVTHDGFSEDTMDTQMQ
jgi:Ca-activated chloride channel homolog